MGLPNMIYQGIVDTSMLEPLGIRKIKSGLYSFPGEGDIQRWYVAPRRAQARIHAYIESLDHDFGNYTAHFIMRSSGHRSSLRITGRAGHPHYNGSMCWGNMASMRDYALERHDIESVAGIVALTLTTYNPNNPYGGWWNRRDVDVSEDQLCISCGSKKVGYTCRSCNSHLCAVCEIRCRRIEAQERDTIWYYCRSCVTDTVCAPDDCDFDTCAFYPKPKKKVVQARGEQMSFFSNEAEVRWSTAGLDALRIADPVPDWEELPYHE